MASTSNTFKNNYSRKRRAKKKSPMYKKIANVARQVVQQELAEEIEQKTYDKENIGLTVSSTSGRVEPILDLMVGGTGIDEKIGNQINIKSVFVRFQVQANSAASYNTLRVMLVRWMAGGTPTTSQILLYGGLGATMRHLSQLNYSNKEYIQVKYDNTFLLSDTANIDLPALAVDKFYIKPVGDAFFDDASNAIKGHLYWVLISDSSVNLPQFTYTLRVRYTDA